MPDSHTSILFMVGMNGSIREARSAFARRHNTLGEAWYQTSNCMPLRWTMFIP